MLERRPMNIARSKLGATEAWNSQEVIRRMFYSRFLSIPNVGLTFACEVFKLNCHVNSNLIDNPFVTVPMNTLQQSILVIFLLLILFIFPRLQRLLWKASTSIVDYINLIFSCSTEVVYCNNYLLVTLGAGAGARHAALASYVHLIACYARSNSMHLCNQRVDVVMGKW